MKILLSAKNISDNYADSRNSEDTQRKNLEDKLRSTFLKGLEQSYFKGQSIEYFNIDRALGTRKPMYKFEFELSNTKSGYTRPFIFGYADITPSKIAAMLNRLHDDKILLLSEEADERSTAIEDKLSNLSEMIDPILVKYGITGQVVLDADVSQLIHEKSIILGWDIDDILGCEYHETELTYRNHILYFPGFSFEGFAVGWDFEKSDKENLKCVESAIAQTVVEVKNWMETVDYVLDNLHSIGNKVSSQLSRFEYDGVSIDDINVKTDLDPYSMSSYRSGSRSAPVIDEAIIISFHIYGYDGKIDLNAKYTWGEWKSMDVNKKLINIINYRKRKYNLN